MTTFLRVMLLCVCIIILPAYAQSDSAFNSAQKTQIQRMIHEYLSDPVHLTQLVKDINQAIALKQQEATRKSISANAKELFFAPNSLVTGNPNGSITIVEFLDYLCPYCKAEQPVLDKIIGLNKDIRLVFKQFSIHGAPAEFAAKAVIASAKQNKFYLFHKALLSYQGNLNEEATLNIAKQVSLDINKLKEDMKSAAVNHQLQADLDLAKAMNINATPTIIIANVTPPKNIQDLPIIKKVLMPEDPREESIIKAINQTK